MWRWKAIGQSDINSSSFSPKSFDPYLTESTMANDPWDAATIKGHLHPALKELKIPFNRKDKKKVLIKKLEQRGVTPSMVLGDEPMSIDSDSSELSEPEDWDDAAEDSFLAREDVISRLPHLAAYAATNRQEVLEATRTLMEKHPSSSIIKFWFFLDMNFREVPDEFESLAEIYLGDPEGSWNYWDHKDTGKDRLEGLESDLADFLGKTPPVRKGNKGGKGRQVVHHDDDDDGDDGDDTDNSSDNDDNDRVDYDSKARRAVREKNRGRQTPAEANCMTIEDPETGEDVEGDILGINPTRRMWLGVALPSANDMFPGLSRATWVDCSKGNYIEAYREYVSKGANHTITAAADDGILEGCRPDEFELNCVLQMPWGKTFHTHALGIPHYQQDREFMLFSKSLLSKQFGTTDAQDLLNSHMQDAKQTIMTKTGEKRIRARAWRK